MISASSGQRVTSWPKRQRTGKHMYFAVTITMQHDLKSNKYRFLLYPSNSLAKNLFGSEEDVQECNQESIGFTEECSMCWTTDQFCARKHCTFLYFQSVLTNQINNFNVAADDITAATCDEALCGPEFVPCSGATRRRMNIVSDIVRPESQQCRQAKEDWSVVFGHP